MPFTKRFISSPLLVTLFTGCLLSPMALAQSAGNPKGTATPAQSDSTKAPPGAGRAASAGSAYNGPLTSEQGPAKARTHTTRSPGTDTAGGLPKKTPGDGAPDANAPRAGAGAARP